MTKEVTPQSNYPVKGTYTEERPVIEIDPEPIDDPRFPGIRWLRRFRPSGASTITFFPNPEFRVF